MINGVDDLLAEAGPDSVLNRFDQAEEPKDGSENQAQKLIAIAAKLEVFHSPQGDGYARLPVRQHYENWLLRSKGFRSWLVREFYLQEHKPPGSQAIQDAIGFLEAKARFEGSEAVLHVRVAGHEDKIYVDLCNPKWEVVQISAVGWRVISDPPIHFRRTNGLLELPTPQLGGSIDQLRGLINIGDDANWILCASWAVAAFRPRGPYPILILQGEQGSAKSTTEKMLRRIVDPFVAPVRSAPRDERDLLIAANNSWVIAYDNLSGIPNWLSDALCRLSTGGGFSTRQLYTNDDEVFFDASRPVILNGIDHLAERPDLADRALILNLPRIPDTQRREEADLYREFEQEQPYILGAFYSAVSVALRRIGCVSLSSQPRMADFACWATAAEPALGIGDGSFIQTYAGNRSEAVQDTIESDPVGAALASFVTSLEDDSWTGTCKALLSELQRSVDELTKKSKAWPNTPRALSSRLKRLTTFLREAGIEITLGHRGTHGVRLVTIAKNGGEFDRH